MSFAVTVLGSSGMFATRDRAASGYLIETEETRIWMDAGAGTWQHLQEHCDWREIDAIVLTHRHPDHTSDLFQGFHARQYGDPEPKSPIPLYAPRETIERLLGFVDDLGDSFQMKELEPDDDIDISGNRFSFVRMAHPAYTLGVRIENSGSVLAYSADTGPDADFKSLARDADVFVCEATFQKPDGEWEGHLHASLAGKIAAEQGCGKLILTHLPPGRDLSRSLDEATATAGSVEVALAEDGLRLDL
jgi:ribonuclease BN (tRNA processing enzyme)